MKCKCANCQLKLFIPDDQLRTLRIPIFKCPNCKQVIKIKPSKVPCAHCKSFFLILKYKITRRQNVVKCPNCFGLNRIAV